MHAQTHVTLGGMHSVCRMPPTCWGYAPPPTPACPSCVPPAAHICRCGRRRPGSRLGSRALATPRDLCTRSAGPGGAPTLPSRRRAPGRAASAPGPGPPAAPSFAPPQRPTACGRGHNSASQARLRGQRRMSVAGGWRDALSGFDFLLAHRPAYLAEQVLARKSCGAQDLPDYVQLRHASSSSSPACRGPPAVAAGSPKAAGA